MIENNKETLERLILEEEKSYEEIGRMFNVSGNAIKKRALKFGMELPKRRVINNSENFNKGLVKVNMNTCKTCGREYKLRKSNSNHYCSHKCQQLARHKEAYNKIKVGDSSIMRANYSPSLFREDILKEQGNKCDICGISPIWNEKRLVFIVDHIDGNASNNRRDNLRCICPDCDSQLDTYKSKNKNGARYYYRYKQG
jgi:hypothetical protein